ncbi:MAG: ATP-grasp domain-containing protein [Bacteroidetes bacterium]|nr:ATP-grasp domain-containing protein [Bacteroidota bacterium]
MATPDQFSVLIPDGEDPQALGVLRCLSQVKKIKIHILSNKKRPLIRYSKYSKHFYYYKNENGNDGQLAMILDMVKKLKPEVVLPVSANIIGVLTENREKFSQLTSLALLPQKEALEIASNKWLLAEWLNKNQIPAPPTILYQPGSNFEKLISEISYPVLIKPAVGTSGNGIEQFDDSETLISYCKTNVQPGKFIIQSFINGYDIDCSALCRNGEIVAFTIQKTFKEGPDRFGVASGIEFLYDEGAYTTAKDLLKKLNWTGIVHIDMRYDEMAKQVKIIEMNPRYWGSLVGSLYAGINFPYLACITALNRDIPEITTRPLRYVRGSLATRMMLNRIFHKNRKDLHFDNSEIETLLKDPFPRFVQTVTRVYSRFVHKR